MNLSRYSILRPVTVSMATLSLLVLGVISLGRLPLTLMPEFSSSNLRVNVDYPSSSPEEVERTITRPLEEVLSTLNYLDSMHSSSSSDGSNVQLEFVQGTDMDLVALEIRDRIDQVRSRLPEDVERVMIRRWQSADVPIFRFAVGWHGERDELYRFAEEILRPRLERLDGVANVEIRGVDPKQVIIELDPGLLQAHDVDVFDLREALRNGNVNVSGGWVREADRKFNLRTVGEFQTVDEIERLPLAGGRFTLQDLGRVSHDFPPRERFARLNGREAVTVSIHKASTANVVSVCGAISDELRAIQTMPQWQGLMSVRVFFDQSESILKSLNDLRVAGLYGGLLAMVVLYLFLLKFRSTLIISVAIPISVVFTCTLMYLLRVFTESEISLNVVSLMGMMVAIGMLVDNSVVVLENIFRHRQERGLEGREAALEGSREVSTAVVASTATTVAVFISFIFVPSSLSGRYIKDFGVVVSAALIASLLVALTVIPMLASRVFTGKERPKQKVFVWMTERYGRMMNGLLRWRFATLPVLVVVGYGTFWLFTNIDRELFPSVAERELRLEVLMERSFSEEEMRQVFERAESILLGNKEELEIASVSGNYNTRSSRRGHYRGSLNIHLTEEGTTPTQVLQGRIRDGLPAIAGVEFRFGRMRYRGGGSEMGVEVQLVGDDPGLLATYGDVVRARMAELPGVSEVQTTLESGDDEIHLVVDRDKVEKMGVSSSRLARTIAAALSTRASTRYRSDNGEVDVILQLQGGNEISLSELSNISIENRQGEAIPLHTLVSYEYEKGPVAIQREDRKSTLSVSGNTERGASFFVSGMVENMMSEIELPAGYSWNQGRQFRFFRQSEEESFFAVVLALIFMYIIMASLFESFVHPLTILFTVPFSLVGVAVIYNLTNTTLNQMAYLGILVLFGIVVNNGIILIDHINNLRRSGMSRNQAVLQGGMDRLRPILMTAATSIFGLLPLTLPFLLPEYFVASEGRARQWAPVSLAVFGGLTTSTFLTVIILPVIYSYMDDLSRLLWRAWEAAGGLWSANGRASDPVS